MIVGRMSVEDRVFKQHFTEEGTFMIGLDRGIGVLQAKSKVKIEGECGT